MEYCVSNLKQIKDSLFQFDEHRICRILKDVGTGLKILHESDMVHLDIKPGKLNGKIIRFLIHLLRMHTQNFLFS